MMPSNGLVKGNQIWSPDGLSRSLIGHQERMTQNKIESLFYYKQMNEWTQLGIDFDFFKPVFYATSHLKHYVQFQIWLKSCFTFAQAP